MNSAPVLPDMPIRVGSSGMHGEHGSGFGASYEECDEGSIFLYEGQTKWRWELHFVFPLVPYPVLAKLMNVRGQLVRQPYGINWAKLFR